MVAIPYRASDGDQRDLDAALPGRAVSQDDPADTGIEVDGAKFGLEGRSFKYNSPFVVLEVVSTAFASMEILTPSSGVPSIGIQRAVNVFADEHASAVEMR